jgi:uncharacterized protein (TIGR03435 family)
MHRARLIGTLLTIAAAISAQTAPPAPAFEAADVHPSAHMVNQFLQVSFSPRGRYELRNATMADLIRSAYTVDNEAIYGGPNWMDSDRFDVIAKVPPKSTEAERALMLRALLAARFQLATHNEDKPLDVFSLTAGKKILMKESDGPGEPGCKSAPNPGNQPQPYIVVDCVHMTMTEFARQARQMAGGYIIHQVLDLTGITGSYDFTIKWTGRARLIQLQNQNDPNAEQPISFFDAVDKQLGLKLVAEKHAAPALVIDRVNRTPTPNAPDINALIPALPTEFDAAVVKASKPNQQGAQFRPRAGGQLEITNAPLKLMIGAGWGFENDQDRVVGAPKWVDSDKFDVIAKTSEFPVDSPPPIDSVRIMLRNLLIDRFKLAAHLEDRDVPVFLLRVSKGGVKMKPADPQSRSNCKATPGTVNGGLVINLACTNTSAAQLTEQMRQINGGGGYLDHPAVDVTGLKGGYDFTLAWSPRGGGGDGARKAPGAGDGSAASTASDPSGGITLFDALERELGLHLEAGKHPMQVLVVDKIDHLAADN